MKEKSNATLRRAASLRCRTDAAIAVDFPADGCVPYIILHGLGHCQQITGQHNHHAHDQFRHSRAIASAAIDHGDAPAGGRFHIDLIVTRAEAADQLQPGRQIHHFGSDGHDAGNRNIAILKHIIPHGPGQQIHIVSVQKLHIHVLADIAIDEFGIRPIVISGDFNV